MNSIPNNSDKDSKNWIVVTQVPPIDVHVYPLNDLKPHYATESCPCHPDIIDYEGADIPIYSHFAWDYRDLWFELKKKGIKGIDIEDD